MSKQRIGYIGVGLMGHGAARNILANGYPLTIIGHRNRAPIDDLIARGAREAKTPADVARASRGRLPVPALLGRGRGHALRRARCGCRRGRGPDRRRFDDVRSLRSTQRIGADLAQRGIRMADAPVGRTPKEAEEGKLSTFIGGDPETVRAVRPIIECYADTIIEAGELGAGHTLKLINNFISIGTCAVIAEAVATAAKLGVDLRKLYDVVSAGGANSKMFQMVMPWVLEGDDEPPEGAAAHRRQGHALLHEARRERAGNGVHCAGGQPDLPAREHPGARRALHAGAARHSRRAQRLQDPRSRRLNLTLRSAHSEAGLRGKRRSLARSCWRQSIAPVWS